ncbi:hypothetical protein E1264_03470 [Actinomadura sp. KC216]|uniref:hypothetical protein n=1 Tax=Actinomadura sp. KC216 TaxID=2530370 RepID=UPI00104F135F|nr:hypothetical protein [Actinomadura sp. KC216]TDB90899.1 hypothetical protein E1264_03470 [Actinomadura sp. KC216]
MSDESPPDLVKSRAPTVWDVVRWPEYYISGPGRQQAGETRCDHGYKLTDSCPGCDVDKEDLREKLNK